MMLEGWTLRFKDTCMSLPVGSFERWGALDALTYPFGCYTLCSIVSLKAYRHESLPTSLEVACREVYEAYDLEKNFHIKAKARYGFDSHVHISAPMQISLTYLGSADAAASFFERWLHTYCSQEFSELWPNGAIEIMSLWPHIHDSQLLRIILTTYGSTWHSPPSAAGIGYRMVNREGREVTSLFSGTMVAISRAVMALMLSQTVEAAEVLPFLQQAESAFDDLGFQSHFHSSPLSLLCSKCAASVGDGRTALKYAGQELSRNVNPAKQIQALISMGGILG